MHLLTIAIICTVLSLSACDQQVTEPASSKQATAAQQQTVVPAVGMLHASSKQPTSTQAASDIDPGHVLAGAAAAAGQRVTGGPGRVRRIPDPPFASTEVARFDEPWAMTFLPDGRLLVTEKKGKLKLLNVATGQMGDVTGVPTVAYGGQGGFGDVVLHPQFASNRWVYLSYAESGANSTRGAVVVRAQLTLTPGANTGSLSNPQVIWQQIKVSGENHYSHRIAFDRGGKLFITSGERQKFTPAQDMQSNLGKVVRLNDDGSIPSDNPFVNQGGVAAQVWTLGHRNLLGIAFDAQGQLWEHEMGPAGGDELNLIERGSNYGWPVVSNGDNYDGSVIPDHDTRPEFNAPEAWWTPVIAPAGFIIYSGDMFPYFRGNGFIGGLASQALIRVEFNGVQGREVARYSFGGRIREVEQGPDGTIWLLRDGVNAPLFKLTPNFN